MPKELTLVKLGGSLITNKLKPNTPRLRTIARLAQEIKSTRCFLVVGHGGGSFGHTPAVKYKTAHGLIDNTSLRGISEVQDAVARLNRLVFKQFLGVGLNPLSITPSICMCAVNGNMHNSFLETLEMSLKLGLLPVVHGDVVLDKAKGCTIFSTERILNFLATKLTGEYKIRMIVHCGITDGVYDESGKTVKVINKVLFNKMKTSIKTSHGPDATGGMLHKVEECLLAAGHGIKSLIINGDRIGELESVLTGGKHHGTEVV